MFWAGGHSQIRQPADEQLHYEMLPFYRYKVLKYLLIADDKEPGSCTLGDARLHIL